MQASFRQSHIVRDRSRLIFAMLVSCLLIAVGLLVASGDSGVAAESPALSVSKNTNAPEVATSNVVTSASKIVYIRNRGDGSPSRLLSMDADGGNVFTYTTVAVPAQPDISVDGSKIVFIESAPSNIGGDLIVMNADGSGEHAIDSPAVPDLDVFPSWSPDGSKIVFARYNENNPESGSVYIINADGSNLHQIAPPTLDSFSYLDWSPDGTKIAYVVAFTGLYVMNADGSNQHMVVPGNIRNLAWSPDGSKFAYSNSTNSLWIANSDGSNAHVIPNVPAGMDPTWSPDGNWIAYYGGLGDIYKTKPDGTGITALTNTPSPVGEWEPSWGGSAPSKVVVEKVNGNPVQGAQVYKNCELLGTTNISGTLLLTEPLAVGDQLIARSLVYTGTTQKGSHDGWAYHVYLTNFRQSIFGDENSYLVTDTSRITQTLTISPTQAQIGFNIVASVEFNASDYMLEVIGKGLGGTRNPNGGYQVGGSDFLMDVTDGQMYLEKITIYEDKQHWNDADYQFFAYFPRANANINSDGRSMLTGTIGQIHMQASGDFGTPWTQASAFSTMIHELSHYALGVFDEYYYLQDGDNAKCTLNPNPSYRQRASIMANNRNSSEFCTSANHNAQTHQGEVQHESVWESVVDNWSDDQNRWQIIDPVTRGFSVLGPDIPACPAVEGTIANIVSSSTQACGALNTLVTKDGVPVVGIPVTLQHNGYAIDEGVTDTNGFVRVFGVVAGDKVTARDTGFLGSFYTGEVVVESCGPIEIELSIFRDGPAGSEGATGQSPMQWPTYGISAMPNFTTNKITASMQFAGDTPSAPVLYASQGGVNRQQVTLTYNAGQHTYAGDYTFDPNKALDFQLEVGLTGPQGVLLFPYKFTGAKFLTAGPFGESQEAPAGWDLFPPEDKVNLSVNSSSMPNNTGVMGGYTDLPAAPPSGMKAVGGPFSIQGQNAISGQVHVSLEFQDEYFCGLVDGSTAIYRFNGTSWEAVTSEINHEWHFAAASLTQWGTYAVFAQLSPQTSFSDVPAGSTFYDYVGWITCHGIASGYSDGTFRPNNNATRGQIAKMMALAYKWALESPDFEMEAAQEQGGILWRGKEAGGQAYSFADVLPGSTFYLYVEAAYREGVVGGYACGGAGEPCDSENRPYFRPANNVTRGQIAKIISTGSKFDDVVSGQAFEDVAPGSTFYDYIGRMVSKGIINGYACGGAGEPCGAGNRPYFRPSANATRGQLSKMIYLAAQPR